MSLRDEAKRVEFGQSLNETDQNVTGIETRLTMIQDSLNNMKSEMAANNIFAQEDIDEVDSVLSRVTVLLAK